MIKTNYDARNYIYVLSTIDDLEYIIEVADTQQEMADILGVNLSSVCRLFIRHARNENVIFYKNRKLERVKIYDYVFIVFEKDISSPLCVSKDLNKLAEMCQCSKYNLLDCLHNYEKSKAGKQQYKKNNVRKLQGKYFIKQIDLLDLDISLSKFLENCIDKGRITTRFNADFETLEDVCQRLKLKT